MRFLEWESLYDEEIRETDTEIQALIKYGSSAALRRAAGLTSFKAKNLTPRQNHGIVKEWTEFKAKVKSVMDAARSEGYEVGWYDQSKVYKDLEK